MPKTDKTVSDMAVVDELRGLVSAQPNEIIVELALGSLLPNPYQPPGRLTAAPEDTERLALDIRDNSQHSPVIVRACAGRGGMYEVGDGWQRYLSFKWLSDAVPGFDKIKAVIRSITDQQMADLIPSSAMHRPLTQIDKAHYYVRYMQDFGVTQTELAKAQNVTQGEIANTIRLLDLPEDIQGKVISQEISPTHARQLLRIKDPKEQDKMTGRVIESGMSVSQLSNEIASQIYHASKNIEPDDYPKPTFDLAECKPCPNRQKLGIPYSNGTKEWRCLDPACYGRKTAEAEDARIKQLQEEIAAAKQASGQDMEAGILDLKALGYGKYEELGGNYKKVDNPAECKTCPRTAMGQGYGAVQKVCIDMACFKGKEKAYETRQKEKEKEAERQLTERVKAACINLRDESTPFKLIVDYLLGHCRKDTREKFGRMYEMKESEISHWYAVNIPADEPEVIIRTAAMVLTLERYEGEKGIFQKMLADIEGNSAELDKALDSHRAKHCQGCVNDNDNRTCRQLLRRYGAGWHDKCYHYSKAPEDDNEDAGEPETPDAEVLILPCETCAANDVICHRERFHVDESGAYVCEMKIETEVHDVLEQVVDIVTSPESDVENVIYVDRETLEKLGASNSCGEIMEGKTVRPTVTVNDGLYLATGGISNGMDGMLEVNAYKVASISPGGEFPHGYPDVKLRTYKVPRGRVYEEYYESLRNDPMGFYHGMVVKKAKGEWVLIGPEITFKPMPDTIETGDILAGLEIRTAYSGDMIKLGAFEVWCKRLSQCVVALGEHLGWGENPQHILKQLQALPQSRNRDLLAGILEGKRPGSV